MMRAATILWALLAMIAGTGLFLLKYQVQAEERHLRDLRKDIAGTQQSIHVLKAEWSYLNDPSRLSEQALRHLDMRPMRVSQIVTLDSIPLRGEPAYLPPGLAAASPSQQAKPTEPGGAVNKQSAARKSVAGRTVTAWHARPRRSQQVASSRVQP